MTGRFAPRVVYGGIDITAAPFMLAFGFDLGAPQTVYDLIDSLVTDGAFQQTKGSGNRTLQLAVYVEAGSGAEATALVRPLHVAAGLERNTLTFYSGDGTEDGTVLETFTAQLDYDWDQNAEQAGLRKYVLTVPAMPFTRSPTLRTLTWSGPVSVAPMTSLSGWSVVGSGALETANVGIPFVQVIQKTTNGGAITVKRTMTLDNHLWVVAPTGGVSNPAHYLTGVVIDGVAIDDATVRMEHPGASVDSYGAYTIPTERFRGRTVDVQFTLTATGSGVRARMVAIYTRGYPAAFSAGIYTPRGIDVINTIGTERAPCTISFTVPTGGAFVYTAPDPNTRLRQYGAGEVMFAKVTAGTSAAEITAGANVTYLAGGAVTARDIGTTPPQPPALNPSGIWPTTATYSITGGTVTVNAGPFLYPIDPRAAVTFFPASAGNVTLISPSFDLFDGFQSGADFYEPHILHPDRSGFAVLTKNGDPITATVQWYPRWPFHAGA